MPHFNTILPSTSHRLPKRHFPLIVY